MAFLCVFKRGEGDTNDVERVKWVNEFAGVPVYKCKDTIIACDPVDTWLVIHRLKNPSLSNHHLMRVPLPAPSFSSINNYTLAISIATIRVNGLGFSSIIFGLVVCFFIVFMC